MMKSRKFVKASLFQKKDKTVASTNTASPPQADTKSNCEDDNSYSHHDISFIKLQHSEEVPPTTVDSTDEAVATYQVPILQSILTEADFRSGQLELICIFDLPGCSADNVHVDYSSGTVQIKATRNDVWTWMQGQRDWSSVSSFTVNKSAAIDVTKMVAHLVEGVLAVVAPQVATANTVTKESAIKETTEKVDVEERTEKVARKGRTQKRKESTEKVAGKETTDWFTLGTSKFSLGKSSVTPRRSLGQRRSFRGDHRKRGGATSVHPVEQQSPFSPDSQQTPPEGNQGQMSPLFVLQASQQEKASVNSTSVSDSQTPPEEASQSQCHAVDISQPQCHSEESCFEDVSQLQTHTKEEDSHPHCDSKEEDYRPQSQSKIDVSKAQSLSDEGPQSQRVSEEGSQSEQTCCATRRSSNGKSNDNITQLSDVPSKPFMEKMSNLKQGDGTLSSCASRTETLIEDQPSASTAFGNPFKYLRLRVDSQSSPGKFELEAECLDGDTEKTEHRFSEGSSGFSLAKSSSTTKSPRQTKLARGDHRTRAEVTPRESWYQANPNEKGIQATANPLFVFGASQQENISNNPREVSDSSSHSGEVSIKCQSKEDVAQSQCHSKHGVAQSQCHSEDVSQIQCHSKQDFSRSHQTCHTTPRHSNGKSDVDATQSIEVLLQPFSAETSNTTRGDGTVSSCASPTEAFVDEQSSASTALLNPLKQLQLFVDGQLSHGELLTEETCLDGDNEVELELDLDSLSTTEGRLSLRISGHPPDSSTLAKLEDEVTDCLHTEKYDSSSKLEESSNLVQEGHQQTSVSLDGKNDCALNENLNDPSLRSVSAVKADTYDSCSYDGPSRLEQTRTEPADIMQTEVSQSCTEAKGAHEALDQETIKYSIAPVPQVVLISSECKASIRSDTDCTAEKCACLFFSEGCTSTQSPSEPAAIMPAKGLHSCVEVQDAHGTIDQEEMKCAIAPASQTEVISSVSKDSVPSDTECPCWISAQRRSGAADISSDGLLSHTKWQGGHDPLDRETIHMVYQKTNCLVIELSDFPDDKETNSHHDIGKEVNVTDASGTFFSNAFEQDEDLASYSSSEYILEFATASTETGSKSAFEVISPIDVGSDESCKLSSPPDHSPSSLDELGWNFLI